jgi:transcriptional regulator of arginine metabolism
MSKNRMARLFQDSIVCVDSALNQIVIHTLPGSASMVASAVDHAKWESVIGTIAGDDCILIITNNPETVPQLVRVIVTLMKE